MLSVEPSPNSTLTGTAQPGGEKLRYSSKLKLSVVTALRGSRPSSLYTPPPLFDVWTVNALEISLLICQHEAHARGVGSCRLGRRARMCLGPSNQ
eukprot:632092-Rhodomonas_salina.1